MVKVVLEVGGQEIKVTLAELEKLHVELLDFFAGATEVEPVEDEEIVEATTEPDEPGEDSADDGDDWP